MPRVLLLATFAVGTLWSATQSVPGQEGPASDAQQHTYPAPTNLKVLPKEMTGQQVHDLMERWAGDLGVRCSACHEEEHTLSGSPTGLQFAADSKPMKAVARRMYTMTDAINGKFLAKIDNSGMPVTCGTCHQGRINPELQGPALDVAESAEGHPVQATPPEPCFQCHADGRAAFSLPFRHKVEEGLISCTDCHERHGADNKPHPMTATQIDRVCTKCHTETAGPFTHEHAVVKTEGCVACHEPHGGSHPNLLNRAKVDTICLLCHYPSRTSTTGAPVSQAHDLGTQLQPCTACHADIHGSNTSAALLKK